MTLRPAIKRATEIEAVCPGNGTCSYLQEGQAQVWFSCGHYQGLKKNGIGWLVRCDYPQGGIFLCAGCGAAIDLENEESLCPACEEQSVNRPCGWEED